MASGKYLGSLYAVLGLETKDWDKSVAKLERNLRTVGNQFEQFGIRAAAFSVPVAMALKKSLDSFREFDTAFAGIRKTVENTSNVDDKTFFKALETEIRDLSKVMPQSAADLAKIGENAGQLGVSAQHMMPFIKTMAQLGDATDLTSDQAAIAFAQFANVINLPLENIDELGDALVLLGNKGVSFESMILAMGKDFATAANNAGLLPVEILALGSALSGLGEETEAGASSLSKLLAQMSDAVALGGDQLKEFSRISGVDFKKAMQEDASGAIEKFLVGLEGIRRSVGTLTPTLENLEINDRRLIRATEKLASANGMVSTSFGLVSEKSKYAGKLAEEAAKRYETLDSQLKIMRNNVNDVAISFGERMVPAVKLAGAVFVGLATAFDALPTFLKDFIMYFSAFAAIVVPATLAVALFTKALGIIGIASLGAMAGWVALAAALATGAHFIYENWTAIGTFLDGFFERLFAKMTISFKNWVNSVINLINLAIQPITRFFSDIASGFIQMSNMFLRTNFAPITEAFTPLKIDLLDVNKNIDAATSGMNKMKEASAAIGKSSEKSWTSIVSGISSAKQKVAEYLAKQDENLDKNKKLSKAEKDRIKQLEKMEEIAKKASDYLDDRLTDIQQKIRETDIQKEIETAFNKGDKEALANWKTKLEEATRQAITDAFIKKGGQLPLTKEDAKKVGELAAIEAQAEYDKMMEQFGKKAGEGLLGELPNYLSKTITDSILTGFEEGFSSDSIKGFGDSIASLFAQEFQNTFQELFKPGGFSMEALGTSFANLGAAYGVNSLFANASDNEKDVKGGIAAGAIGGASLGFMVGGPVGAAVGGVVGAGAGYFVGASGKSTSSDTRRRHETVNFIEGLIDDKYLSFLQEQGNIVEGYNYRFNDKIDNPWYRGAVNDVANLAGPAMGYPDSVSDPVTNAVVGETQYGNPNAGPGSIGGPDWASQYWTQFGQEGGASFMALGSAFSQMADQLGPQMEQIGVILAENLSGNLDNARTLLQTLDISAEDLAESFLQIGYSGEQSWHEVEVYMQRIPELTGAGLIAFGDLSGAVERFRETTGRGKGALIELKNIMAEAADKGITNFTDLRTEMIAQGVAVEDVDRILQAFAQRGITDMESFGAATDRELGGVVADIESLGFQWKDMGKDIQGAATNIDTLSKKLDTISNKQVDVKINIDYEENNKPKALEKNANFDFSKNSYNGSKTPSVQANIPASNPKNENLQKSSFVVNVDAKGASDPSIDTKIVAAVLASQKKIIQGTVDVMTEMKRRGA